MQKPRIALVVPNLAEGGGVTSSADFIYGAIKRSGQFEVDLISLATSALDSASLRLGRPATWRSGVRVLNDDWRGRSVRHIGARWVELEFSRYLPRKELTQLLNAYDLVQVVSGTPAWAYSCSTLAIPVALHVASLVEIERESFLAQQSGALRIWRRGMTAITKKLDVAAVNRVDAVFAMNPRLFNRLQREPFKNDHVILAPPGVDTEFFKPIPNYSRSEDYILSVGRFSDPRKNLPLLLRAYAALVRLVPAAPGLTLAGSQPPTANHMALATELGIVERLRVRENVSYDELADLYRNAMMFVLTSNEEGFGLVITEAMASGAPTISTRSGGPDTIIADGETGILTPLNDVRALTNAMRVLIESPELRRSLSTSGRKSIVDRFSNAVAEEVFLKTYNAVLKTGVEYTASRSRISPQ